MSSSVPDRSLLSPTAIRLSLAYAAAGLSGGIYIPFFGAWLAFKGVSAESMAALLSTGMFLRVIVPPLTGMIADARDDRQSMMIVLFALQFAGYLALNWTDSESAIFLAAVSASVAGSAAGPLQESVSMRLAEHCGFDYGRVRMWNSMVFAASNVVSGLLVARFGLGVMAPWLTVSLALTFLAICFLPSLPRAAAHGSLAIRFRATFAEARELLKSTPFLLFLGAASLDQGSHAFYYGYGGLHWTRLGYSGALIGAIWPLGVIAEAVLFSVSLRLFRSIGATRLLLFGGLGCVVRWTILAFDPPFAFVVFAQILHGATFALAHLGAMYFILKAVPPRLSATAQSLYAVGSNGIAMGLATYAAGRLYPAFGGRTYLLMAAMGLGAMTFAWFLGRGWQGGRITRQGEA